MAVTSTELLSEVAADRIQSGVVVSTVTRVYLVHTDNPADGPLTVLADGSIPAVGSLASTPGGVKMYVTDRSAQRPKGEKKKTQWHAVVNYTSETGTQDSDMPVDDNGKHAQDPTQTAQEVEFAYTNEYEPAYSAEFEKVVRFRAADQTYVDVPSSDLPPGFDGYVGPPVTSSNEWINGLRKRKSILTLRVSRVVDTWNNSWNSLIGKTNNAAFTITESDEDGAAYSETFGIGELLFLLPQKQNLRINGKLFYRVTFVFLVDKENQHRALVPDMGVSRRIFEDQFRNFVGETNSQWSSSEVGELQSQVQPIPSSDGLSGVGQPVKLNGFGQEIAMARPGNAMGTPSHSVNDTFFVVYRTEGEGDYSITGIV